MEEKMVLVEILNEENKLISKEVPENLLSLYLNIGWKKVGQPKKEDKQEIKKEDKVETKIDNKTFVRRNKN